MCQGPHQCVPHNALVVEDFLELSGRGIGLLRSQVSLTAKVSRVERGEGWVLSQVVGQSSLKELYRLRGIATADFNLCPDSRQPDVIELGIVGEALAQFLGDRFRVRSIPDFCEGKGSHDLR